MPLLKKHINLSGSSLLESVVSLSIISICLYVTVLVYTTVFNDKTSINYHSKTLECYSVFYNSLIENNNDTLIKNIQFEEEWITSDLKIIKMNFIDSTGNHYIRKYYVQN